jgi:hypothetical protein
MPTAAMDPACYLVVEEEFPSVDVVEVPRPDGADVVDRGRLVGDDDPATSVVDDIGVEVVDVEVVDVVDSTGRVVVVVVVVGRVDGGIVSAVVPGGDVVTVPNAGAGAGRTRMYVTRVAMKSPVMTAVEGRTRRCIRSRGPRRDADGLEVGWHDDALFLQRGGDAGAKFPTHLELLAGQRA